MSRFTESVGEFIGGVGETLATVVYERFTPEQSPDVGVANLESAAVSMGAEPYVEPSDVLMQEVAAPAVGRIAAEITPALPVQTPEVIVPADEPLAPVINLDERRREKALQKLREQVEVARQTSQQIETTPVAADEQPIAKVINLFPANQASEQQDSHLEDLRRQVERAIASSEAA